MNMKFGRIFGLKRTEVTGFWINLRNEGLRYTYCSPSRSCVKVIEERWDRSLVNAMLAYRILAETTKD
jgi:hypothetical protein